ncbi:MAG: hypothetical protein JSV33_04075 [bacterium]|nr:MAG: hypothetical protein JSV33_04075 [bacterium]
MRIFRDNKGLTGVSITVSLIVVAVFFPALLNPQESTTEVLTNLEVVEFVSTEAIEELIDNMGGLTKDGLVILKKEKSVGDIDFVFENLLLKSLNDAGWRVSHGKGQVADTLLPTGDFEFGYQLIKLNLAYPKISRHYWFGQKNVERLAEVGVFAKLVDLSTGDIVWVGDVHKEYDDAISYALLDRVEDEQYEFTRPARNELRWKRLLEPLIVTGIVTGLVYLFFSNQSND